jgi:hypothetical protein
MTGMSTAYFQKATNYIARQCFSPLRVMKQSDLYFVFDKNTLLLDQAQPRADGAPAEVTGYKLSTARYAAVVYGLAEKIGNQRRANSDTPLDPERNAVQHLTQKALIRQERDFVNSFMTTGKWGTDKVGQATSDATHNVFWDDYVNSSPIEDIEFGKETILGNTGFDPNRLVLQNKVFRYLKRNPEVIDLFKYTTSRTVTADILASMFDLELVLVAKAIYASNVEGETPVYGAIHGKNALLAFASEEPALETPTAGAIFIWDDEGRMNGGGGDPFGIRTWFEQKEKADYVEIEGAWDNQIIGTDLGFFFSSIVSATA